MKQGPGSRIPFRHRLTVRLTTAVIVALLFIGSPFLLAFHTLRRSQEIEALAEATHRLSQVTVDGLRAAMLAGAPHLMDEAVRRMADQEQVERVLLLDHGRRVQVSSGEVPEGRVVDRETDPICSTCHESSTVSPNSRTLVAVADGRRVLRAMTTIPNEPRCHGCHDPADPINGVLVMDLALVGTDSRFFADIGRTVALGAVMVLLTVVVLVWLLRGMVHRPLQAMVGASRRIVEGDLDAQAEVGGAGEFARLASQVNRMTSHLSRSLRTVENQRRELQTILDAIDDEVIVLDPEQRIIMANAAFREKSDQRGEDRSAGRGQAAAPGGDEPAGDGPVRQVFRTGQLQKGIVSWTDREGREHATEIHVSPLRGADGEVSRAVEVRRDISERRQMEAVVAQSERLASLGLLASGLSHEINNPLGAIATTVEGLRRRLTDESGVSPEAADALDGVLARVDREVARCRVITHRLLEVARPAGSRGLADLNHVVENILAILSHDIKRSGIATRLRLGKLPPLRVDETQLGQVVMNLTLNAIQAMSGRGGELRIETSVTGGTVEALFEDTGCGIPPQLLQRIFEPFFTTKPAGQGTGLGLFITHRIVSDLGGTIGVRSEPGAGTSFTVRIPRNRGREP